MIHPHSRHNVPRRATPTPVGAMTWIDVVVMMASVSLLLGIAGFTFAGNDPGSGASVCINNLRRLTLAWQMYASDNNGRLVGASAQGGVPEWSGASWLTLNNPSDANNWNHEQFTKKSPLWRYI